MQPTSRQDPEQHPERHPQERLEPRRRWPWGTPGSTFLDLPADDRYAHRWLFACGQGG